MSVGFADREEAFYLKNGYRVEQSAIGRVYIPTDVVEISGPVAIRYERHPWIETFEVDGVRPLAPKRKGFGTKDVKSFVQSLNTIYAPAFEEFEKFGDPADYFEHVADYFTVSCHDTAKSKMFRKFCGYTENLWREGTEKMYDIAMNTVLPVIAVDEEAYRIFMDSITQEFREYIKGEKYGK